MSVKSNVLGYPRIGAKRELKKATEKYWKGRITLEELKQVGRDIRKTNWLKQKKAGIDLIPVNDFSFYDQVLDMSCILGNIPKRFEVAKGDNLDLDTAFLVARGTRDVATLAEDEKDCQTNKISTFASEMTKWFDTNYHFIVPEFSADTTFRLASAKVFDEFQEAKDLGINAKPVLIGPLTYLTLGKVQDKANPDYDRFELLDRLLDVYEEIVGKLGEQGAEWIQFDEPIFALDLNDVQKEGLNNAYTRLKKAAGNTKLIVTTYFGELRDNLSSFCSLPVDGLHYDVTRAGNELDQLLNVFPEDKVLSLGVIDGRNIWKNDYTSSIATLRKAKDKVGSDRLWVGTSCSLLHSPVTLDNETELDTDLKNWLAFADQKLVEAVDLANIVNGTAEDNILQNNQVAIESRRQSTKIHNQEVKKRYAAIKESDYARQAVFEKRKVEQAEKLHLPAYPTTTIGSFPQTKEVRQARADWKKGTISNEEYDAFIKEEIRKCISFQDEIGIDVPVHGEFERNDMVEYFGENLEGFAFTQHGWVQSYGSRYVKPPVIFGDVYRAKPMTTYWSEYAQTLTDKPMKGMLTGPVTILQWSFVRDDQPRSQTAYQIGLAIRDEVVDLEKVGIAVIQIDEPAFREGLPLRRSDWDDYLNWAVKAFRLSSCGVRNDTQIHTHMCYSEFNDIIEAIADLDADVITIETSRSNMELLDAFVNFKYPNEIGPGVYDIHSPRVPHTKEMTNLMNKAKELIPGDNLWVNPDCGLKTRQWEEVKPSLANMVECARQLRG